MMAAIVREARPDDYPTVADITVAAYRSAASDGEVPAALRPGGHFERIYAPALRDVASRASHAVVLVAEADGVVLGAVTYVPGEGPYAEFEEPDSAGVRHLAVDPTVQRMGAGRALMEECLARARREGRRRIVLHTQSHMHSARALYALMGFKRAPERDFRPAPDVDLQGYVLELQT
jgi:ribosomal protein S18 acetylase RimI-like enzyme